jgi:sulfur carrier protein
MDISAQQNQLSVTVNGATQQLSKAMTVAELVDQMGLAGKRIAVERNGEIVPRSRLPEVPLTDGDKLEIVVAVGGG